LPVKAHIVRRRLRPAVFVDRFFHFVRFIGIAAGMFAGRRWLIGQIRIVGRCIFRILLLGLVIIVHEVELLIVQIFILIICHGALSFRKTRVQVTLRVSVSCLKSSTNRRCRGISKN
jgi:hypothetical protein